MLHYEATGKKLTLAKIAKVVNCMVLAEFMFDHLKYNFQDGILRANKAIVVDSQLISYAEKDRYFMGFLLKDGYLGLKQSNCNKCFGPCPHELESHRDKLVHWAKQMPIAA